MVTLRSDTSRVLVSYRHPGLWGHPTVETGEAGVLCLLHVCHSDCERNLMRLHQHDVTIGVRHSFSETTMSRGDSRGDGRELDHKALFTLC